MFNIVILISGSGTNLQAIIEACKAGKINGVVSGVISNNPKAYGLERAKNYNIPSLIIDHNNFSSREDFDSSLVSGINSFKPDLVVLAGFMRILSPVVTDTFNNMMINIHPSLLPKYPGLDTHTQVLANNDKEHGVTIHSVSAELDGGPIIAQAKITVKSNQKLDGLIKRIHSIEHMLFPKVINLIANNQIKIQELGLKQEVLYENYDV